MDEDDDGGFGFDLGVDDEGLDGAVAVLEGNVLVVAGRGVETGFGPVLRVEGSGGEGKYIRRPRRGQVAPDNLVIPARYA